MLMLGMTRANDRGVYGRQANEEELRGIMENNECTECGGDIDDWCCRAGSMQSSR